MSTPACLVCGARSVAALPWRGAWGGRGARLVPPMSSVGPGGRPEPPRWNCRRCGFLFVDVADGVLGAAYEVTCADGTADAIDEGRRPLFARLLRELTPRGGRRCLDVGSGGGLFVRLAAAAGWEAVGVDRAGPEETGAGYRLARLDFPTAAIPGGPFALVTFLGSLTYMRDPVAALRAAQDEGGDRLHVTGLQVVEVALDALDHAGQLRRHHHEVEAALEDAAGAVVFREACFPTLCPC